MLNIPRLGKNKLYLFGVAGSGKSYIGKLLAREMGFNCFDADQWLPQEAIQEFKVKGELTQEVRNKFHAIIAQKIHELPDAGLFVITQASIKAVNRAQILQVNPNIHMIHVKADPHTLLTRVANKEGAIKPEHVITMLNNFDDPTGEDCFVIDNSELPNVPLLEQLAAIVECIGSWQLL